MALAWGRVKGGILEVHREAASPRAESPSARRTTSPITIVAGGDRWRARSAMSARVPVTTAWAAVVAPLMTAAGVEGGRRRRQEVPVRVRATSLIRHSRSTTAMKLRVVTALWS